jgi:hypothetical protein
MFISGETPIASFDGVAAAAVPADMSANVTISGTKRRMLDMGSPFGRGIVKPREMPTKSFVALGVRVPAPRWAATLIPTIDHLRAR